MSTSSFPTPLLALVLAAPAAAQTTWFVDVNGTAPGSGTPGDPYTSVQYALAQPETVDGDVVRVLPGTYPEAIDFLGKAVRVESAAGAPQTVLDASGLAASVATFQSGEGPDSVLVGFTLTNGTGTFDGPSNSDRGGGVLVRGAAPTLEGCIVDSCEADLGGGLYAEFATVRLERCWFMRNAQPQWTSALGGGLHLFASTATITDCTVRDNRGAFGSGLFLMASTATVTGGTYESNLAYRQGGHVFLGPGSEASIDGALFLGGFSILSNGAGLFAAAATATLDGCVFDGNGADEAGGGLWAEGGSVVTVTGGTFRGNAAARGAGIGADASTVTVSDTLFDANTTSIGGQGAGVWASGPGVSLARCVLWRGRAWGPQGAGGGVFGPVALVQCTLSQNRGTQGSAAFGGTLDSCIVWENPLDPLAGGATAVWSVVEGGAPGTGNQDADPLFFDADGGDFHVMAGSPAIDAANPALPPDADGSPADAGAIPFDATWCPGSAAFYCSAAPSSAGCTAALAAATPDNAPVSGAGDWILDAAGVGAATTGLFFFGQSGPAAVPFAGGTLCVQPPLGRTPIQATGGGVPCGGALALTVNDGTPWLDPGPGGNVWVQVWYRDAGGASGAASSDAVALTFK